MARMLNMGRKKVPVQVGNRLQPARKNRGWSAEELSSQTKKIIPTSTIQKIERGAFAPNIATALVLADTLDTSVDRLFFLDSSHVRLDAEG